MNRFANNRSAMQPDESQRSGPQSGRSDRWVGSSRNHQRNETPRVEKLVNQLRIELPKRDLNELCKYGGVIIGFGCIAMLFMMAWISGPLWFGINMIADGQVFFGCIALLFAATGLVGVRFAYAAIAIGIGVQKNETWSEVHWVDGKLSTVERLWRFKWKRRSKLSSIKKLAIVSNKKSDSEFVELATLKNLEARSELADGPTKKDSSPRSRLEKSKAEQSTRFVVLFGYDAKTLEFVAHELAEHCDSNIAIHPNFSLSSQTHGVRDNAIPASSNSPIVIESSSDELESVEEVVSFEQPADSQIEIENFEHATVLKVPPSGVWNGTKGMMWFSFVWSVICFAVTAGMLHSALTGQLDGSPWMLLILVPFWAVGIGMGLAAYHMGTRRLTIGTTDDQIWIERQSLFGTRVVDLDAAEVLDVGVGPSGMEVNDNPIMEIQIAKADGSQFSMGSQLSLDENRWIANLLKSRIKQNGAASVKNWHVIQKSTTRNRDGIHDRIRIVETVAGETVMVPRDRWFRLLPALIFLGAFLVGGFCLIWFTGDAMAGIFGAIFILVSGLLMALVTCFAFRRFEFEVTKQQLVATRKGLFGKREFRFQNDSSLSVDVGKAAISSSNRQAQQNLVISDSRLKQAFMYQRSTREILYVAATLNILLGFESTRHAGERQT